MQCPYCVNEMEKGVLQAGGSVLWAKKPHRVSLMPRKGEVTLDQNIMGYTAIPSWICKNCRRVITEYEDKEYFL